MDYIDDNESSKIEDLLNYLMDKIEINFSATDDGKDFFDTYNDIEELDEEILFSVLDHIARTEPRKSTQFPRQITVENIKKEKSANLLKIVNKLVRNSNWANIAEDTTDRPKLCYNCESGYCAHIRNHHLEQSDTILENAQRRCDHKNNENAILDCCINCIVDASKDMKKINSENDIILIWDTEDTANYHYWMESMNLENGYSN